MEQLGRLPGCPRQEGCWVRPRMDGHVPVPELTPEKLLHLHPSLSPAISE